MNPTRSLLSIASGLLFFFLLFLLYLRYLIFQVQSWEVTRALWRMTWTLEYIMYPHQITLIPLYSTMYYESCLFDVFIVNQIARWTRKSSLNPYFITLRYFTLPDPKSIKCSSYWVLTYQLLSAEIAFDGHSNFIIYEVRRKGDCSIPSLSHFNIYHSSHHKEGLRVRIKDKLRLNVNSHFSDDIRYCDKGFQNTLRRSIVQPPGVVKVMESRQPYLGHIWFRI